MNKRATWQSGLGIDQAYRWYGFYSRQNSFLSFVVFFLWHNYFSVLFCFVFYHFSLLACFPFFILLALFSFARFCEKLTYFQQKVETYFPTKFYNFNKALMGILLGFERQLKLLCQEFLKGSFENKSTIVILTFYII